MKPLHAKLFWSHFLLRASISDYTSGQALLSSISCYFLLRGLDLRMNQETMVQTSKSLDDQRVLSNAQSSLKCTAKTGSSSNDNSSKKVKIDLAKSTVRIANKVPQGIVGSLAKRLEDHGEHDDMVVSLEKSTTIDSTIVYPDAIKTSRCASENRQIINDANNHTNDIAYSYQTKKDMENSRASVQCPLIQRRLFSQETKERFDTAFGPRRSFLPELDVTCPQKGGGYLDQASNETQCESVSDYLDYDFDPFADQFHAPIAPVMPSSLVAFFSSYSGSLRRYPSPRGAGVSSPTSVLEM